jgi:hypothetical protein
LYFAEIEECPSWLGQAETGEIGRRLFNVSLGNRQVLEAFDIAKEAGGTNRPVVKEFKGINVKDDLRVTLTGVTAGQAPATASAFAETSGPLLCGIEIIAEGW